MVIRMIRFFAFIFLLMCCPYPSASDEITVWVDNKGVTHIGDKPPEDPARIIGREVNRRDSPEEIQRYNAKQKRLQQQKAREEERLRLKHENNRIFEEQARRRQDYNNQIENMRRKRAAERSEDAEFEKQRLRAIENRNYDEARRIRIRSEMRRIERGEQE